MNSLVSILVPTYNRKNLLRVCINSILDQTYENLEIIIIDDASDEPINDIIRELNDPRIKLIVNEKNVGSKMGDREHYRRFVYELMTGDYFIYITDDDYWPNKNFIKKSVEILDNNENVSSVVGSQLSEFFEDEKDLKYLSLENVNQIISNNNHSEKYYYFKDLFKTGYYSGFDFLDKFSKNATSYNISITATLKRKTHCLDSKYLIAKKPSKWQGGYEFHIVPTLKYDMYFINEPCVVARIHKNNASFRFTQFDHYMDSIQSISNAFENINQLEIENENLKKLKYFKKEFLRSLSIAYIFNTFSILRGNKLSLTSKENNQRYVTILDILKVYLKNKIFINIKEISLALTYFGLKLFKSYL